MTYLHRSNFGYDVYTGCQFVGHNTAENDVTHVTEKFKFCTVAYLNKTATTKQAH